MDPILQEIDKALAAKGLSAAAASKLAAGHYSLIKNMKASKAGGERYSVETIKKLAQVLDLEFYFGPPREKGPAPMLTLDARDYTTVPLVAAEASAGPGANNDDEGIEDLLAFRSDWLRKLGLSADAGVLVRVRGDSMEPTLHAGDLALIDRGRKEIRSGRVYALNDIDGQTRIKRLDRAGDKGLILRSDNPAHQAELRSGVEIAMLDVIGEVVWSGHTWR